MPNSDVYHSERWSDQDFFYRLPVDKNEDADYVLILKFSEQYFNEPYMKVFDVVIGDQTVIKDLDIWARSGSKLLPHDEFIRIRTQRGELYVNDKKVKGGFPKIDELQVLFRVGASDNPKVNAILLVKGGLENTHFDNFNNYKKTLIDIKREKEEARLKAESFFQEDAYDFDERIDGQGIFN